MNLKLLTLILFFPVILFAQAKREIKISGVTTVFRNNFLLSINEIDNKIIVSYKIQDSLSSNLKYDEDYVKLDIDLKAVKYDEKTGAFSDDYMSKLTNILERHYLYTCDSLKFSKAKNKAYFKLVNESIASLEKGLPLKRLSLIDGVSIRFVVIEEGKDNLVALIENPDKDYMPLIANLITQTFDLFRKGKNDKYLTQRRTSGY